MRFAIRDDDASYFTQPEQIEGLYAGLWERYPISMAVVPFHGCAISGAVPRILWTGSESFPLHHNTGLVAFLKRRIRQGRISILLHGFDHVDRDGKPEFASGLDERELEGRLARGRRYLQDLLETTVDTFVPPHNAMSPAALAALSRVQMNVLGTFSFRPGLRIFSPACLAPMARRRFFLWRQRRRGWRGRFYPFPLSVEGHQELTCHNLNRDPRCALEDLLGRLEQTHRVDGDFCLAVHYWELKEPPLLGWLARLLERATALGARFVHADDLFADRPVARRREAAA